MSGGNNMEAKENLSANPEKRVSPKSEKTLVYRPLPAKVYPLPAPDHALSIAHTIA
jgi:hypothetical protein